MKAKNIITVALVGTIWGTLTLMCLFGKENTFSKAERRSLAAFPEVNKENIVSGQFMTDFDEYTLDQFPLRDSFRTIKAVTSLYVFNKSDNNNIYIADGYASKIDGQLNEKSVAHLTNVLKDVYENNISNTDAHVYMTVIPDKNYYLAKENGYPSLDYAALTQLMKDNVSYAEYIGIADLLDISDYYHTDTHWRQEKITDVADRLLLTMTGNHTEAFEEVKTTAKFYGVYYGQAALPLRHDSMSYLTNTTIENCKMYNLEKDTKMPLYSLDKLDSYDPYEMYLDGSAAFLEITNENAKTDKELIVIRDSFGSSLIPLLTSQYKKITVVDFRYMNHMLWKEYIDVDNQDILIMYSTLLINNSYTVK